MSSSGLLCEMAGEKHDFERRDSVEDRIVLEKLEELKSNDEQSEDELRHHEAEIIQLGERYCKQGKTEAMSDLIKKVRPFLSYLSKAKAAKLVRALVDMFIDINGSCLTPPPVVGGVNFEADFMRDDDVRKSNAGLRIQLCKECIEWAKDERRTFLRQSLESRLVALYYDGGHYAEALALSEALLRELKKLDDKQLLVDVQLMESKTYLELGHVTKARASLTAARTTANTIYIGPKIQAELEMQAGILHCSSAGSQSGEGLMPVELFGGQETNVYYSGASGGGDFKTAYSHFYEAFELFDSVGELSDRSARASNVSVADSSPSSSSTTTTSSSLSSQPTSKDGERSATTAPRTTIGLGHKKQRIDTTAMSVKALKYMLLAKVMLGLPDEVVHIVTNTKLGMKYYAAKKSQPQSADSCLASSRTTIHSATDQALAAQKALADEYGSMTCVTKQLEAMLAISRAAKDRSLAAFNAARAVFSREISGDRVVARHLGRLFQTMLEHNLCRLIEPYSRIQINFVANKIGLDPVEVERKLSQMILDKKFEGILDQANGVLIVYGRRETDATYDMVLATLEAMTKVVDRLFVASDKLK